MKLPYVIANFYSLREEDHIYVDRTEHIRTLPIPPANVIAGIKADCLQEDDTF